MKNNFIKEFSLILWNIITGKNVSKLEEKIELLEGRLAFVQAMKDELAEKELILSKEILELNETIINLKESNSVLENQFKSYAYTYRGRKLSEGEKEDKDQILKVMLMDNEDDVIKYAKNIAGDNLFSVNEEDDGFSVTIGFTDFGEDRCTKSMTTRLDAVKFSAMRMLLGYSIIDN